MSINHIKQSLITDPMKSSSKDFSKLLGGTGGGCCGPLDVFPLLSLFIPMRGDLFVVPLTCGDSLGAPGTCRISGRSCCKR